MHYFTSVAFKPLPVIEKYMNQRKEHIDKFYSLIAELEYHQPKRQLKTSNGYMKWPEKGVYFFFESNELRENSDPRVVRIGTHAISEGSRRNLWGRLRQHKGQKNGKGNHRISVFRKLIGFSLIGKDKLTYPYWGEDKKRISKETLISEVPLEIRVSQIIGDMKFLCLEVPGESQKNNDRAIIEKNSIALLSNKHKEHIIDSQSENWLGKYSGHKDVIESGLWNSDHTELIYDPCFLEKFESLIKKMTT